MQISRLLPTLLVGSPPETRRDCISSLLVAAVTAATASSVLSPTDVCAAALSAVPDDGAGEPPVPGIGQYDGPPPRGLVVTLPLEPCPGGALCLRITAIGQASAPVPLPAWPTKRSAAFRVYRLIVDTGSPYLVFSSGLDHDVIASGSYPIDGELDGFTGEFSKAVALIQQALGILLPDPMVPGAYGAPFSFGPSGYEQTEEIYGSQAGFIQWNTSRVQFRDRAIVATNEDCGLVLGVMDEALAIESGGSLVGLIKRSNNISKKIQRRPTFLEQLRIRRSITDNGGENNDVAVADLAEQEISSFKLDYPNHNLVLSTTSLIPSGSNLVSEVFPLVDLRPFGDFVEHYACKVDEVVFDGQSFDSLKLATQIGERRQYRDIVAVFDSGLSGCLLIRPFWDRLVLEGLDPSRFESVNIKIAGSYKERGRNGRKTQTAIEISSAKNVNKLFYISPVSLDWFDNEDTAPYVIVLGQTFLSQGSLIVDIDARRATFEKGVK